MVLNLTEQKDLQTQPYRAIHLIFNTIFKVFEREFDDSGKGTAKALAITV